MAGGRWRAPGTGELEHGQDRLHQGLDGHSRAGRPPSTALTAHPTMEPREQIQDRREVQFGAAAGSTDDGPTRSCRRPTAHRPAFGASASNWRSSRIRRDRLVVIAHGGYFVTLPGPCDQKPSSCISRTTRLRLTCSSCSIRSGVNARAAIALFARVTGRLDAGPSTAGRLVIVPIPGVVATRRTRYRVTGDLAGRPRIRHRPG